MTRHLSEQIEASLRGPVWHGPAVLEILRDVSPGNAAAPPPSGAHSIWELVLHLAVWAEIARARLSGTDLPSPPPAGDFPAPASPTEENWRAAVARLTQSYAALARDVSALFDSDLATPVHSSEGRIPAEAMLRGIVEHAAYHGGQMSLLKRMSRPG